MMQSSARAIVLGAAGMLAVACESFTAVPAPIRYEATLNGSNEKPNAVTTDATGSFAAALPPDQNTFAYTLAWTGLSSAVIGAHIHGPADVNGVAEILVDFAALPTGSTGSIVTDPEGGVTGALDLSLAVTATVSGDSLKTLLDAGMLYVNVHTVDNPDGEIRGQATRTN